jgi:hypothetical protein
MATTRTQELNALIADNLQNKDDIKNINAKISMFNSSIQILQDQCVNIKDAHDQLMHCSLRTSSSEQPSYQEYHDSSHYQGHHSTHLPRDLCLPRIEVKKFDGSDPTGWVTQMEHYFSLHGITNDLAKLRYGILHLDLERWKWWQWHKKACQGYVAWTQFVADLYDRFDSDTHHLGRLTKLK